MKKLLTLMISFVLLAGGAIRSHAATNQLDSVVITEAEDGNSAIIVIESGKLLDYEVLEISDPPGIQVRFKDEIACVEKFFTESGKKLITNVRYDCGGKSDPPRLEALTFVLRQRCRYRVSQRDWIVSFEIQALSPESARESLPKRKRRKLNGKPVTFHPYAGSYAGAGKFSSGQRTLSASPGLSEFVQVGLANHMPLDIARKELKLANDKLFESRRNFFPAVAARATVSKGATLNDPNDPSTRADFERRELGIELGQPIFQSGRLYYSGKQAKVQTELAELQIGKISLEVTLEIIRTLYAFRLAEENLKIRNELMSESEKIVETTMRKKEIGVASESEYLGAKSIGNQILYKALSQEKDMEIARTRLMAVMNVDVIPEDIQVSLNESAILGLSNDLNLDDALNLGLSRRPGIKIAELTTMFKEYGRKVARAEYLLKIDASGFVGQSGAAFRNETLTMKDSYSFGLQGTLYFGGSSIKPLVSSEKTAPDLGSTSRTETQARSLTVGLLDSLGLRSDYFQAKIDVAKSRVELNKARKDITLEIKEAYFNLEKAKIQIESSKKELEYRKKEATIADVKDRLHQIEAPQYLQAAVSRAESEIAHTEAISFYLTSLASLEKAIGQSLTR